MNEMKIDEISPFPISRLSLRFQFQGNPSIIEWKMFKQAVIEKHGKLHGALGEELSHALQLREYSERERTRTQKPSGKSGCRYFCG